MVNSMMNSMVNWGMVHNSMVDRCVNSMDCMVKRGMVNNRGMACMVGKGMVNNRGMDCMVSKRCMSYNRGWCMGHNRTTCKGSEWNLSISISRCKGQKSSENKSLHVVDVKADKVGA